MENNAELAFSLYQESNVNLTMHAVLKYILVEFFMDSLTVLEHINYWELGNFYCELGNFYCELGKLFWELGNFYCELGKFFSANWESSSENWEISTVNWKLLDTIFASQTAV